MLAALPSLRRPAPGLRLLSTVASMQQRRSMALEQQQQQQAPRTPSAVNPLSNKSSLVLFDDWSQKADLFANPAPVGYSFFSLRKFRIKENFGNAVAEAQIWQLAGRSAMGNLQVKLCADLFLRLNNAIVEGRLDAIKEVTTETLYSGFELASRFPASGLGFAKATGMASRPLLTQVRVIMMPKVQFAQATFICRTLQAKADPMLHPSRPGEVDADFKRRVKPMPVHWRHAPDPKGRLYFYTSGTDGNPVSAWAPQADQLIKAVSYDKRSGTLGSTGKWINDTTVEHIVTLERPLHRQDQNWRIHNF